MADDDADDYMTMTFGEEEPASRGGWSKSRKGESSLQRRIRLEREGRERGRIPSKAELALTADQEREAALSRSLIASASAPSSSHLQSGSGSGPSSTVPSKGLAMMARMGFVPGQALGKKPRPEQKPEAGVGVDADANADANKDSGKDKAGKAGEKDRAFDSPILEPIRIQVKRDRGGIGLVAPSSQEGDDVGSSQRKRPRLENLDPIAYRDRIAKEREVERLERVVHAAQVVAERMAELSNDEEEEEEEPGDKGEKGDKAKGGKRHPEDGESRTSKKNTDKGLASVNVLWRGLVRDRQAAEREKERKKAQQQLLDQALRGNLQSLDPDDDDGDDDDRIALGQTPRPSFLKTGLRRTATKTGPGEDDDNDDDDDGDDDDDDVKDGTETDAELALFEALPPQDRLQQIVDWLRQHRHYCFWCKYTYPDAAMDGCPGPTERDHE